MVFKKSIFFVFTVFVYCESSFVENLSKCNVNDGDCARDNIQTILRDIAKTGVQELGIPRLDPIALHNVSVSALDVLNITLIEGSLKGIKDCVIDKFVSNIKNGRASIELTCDVSIKGHYKVFSNSPLLKTFFGADTLHGDGNGKVKIDKLHLKIDYVIFVQRRNGELYIRSKPDKTVYTFDVKGMSFFADDLYIGEKESSKVITDLLNQNWPLLQSTFSKPFMDKARQFVDTFVHNFFDAVPAKYYISDDLTPYARDE